MAASATRLVELGMVPPLASEVAAQIDANLPVEPGSIVNADINASAAIALSKLATGALPTAITVASANLVDGTIVNADINASAAIATTKLAATADIAALTAARASPAAYSTTGANLAAVLVALGVMAPA